MNALVKVEAVAGLTAFRARVTLQAIITDSVFWFLSLWNEVVEALNFLPASAAFHCVIPWTAPPAYTCGVEIVAACAFTVAL